MLAVGVPSARRWGSWFGRRCPVARRSTPANAIDRTTSVHRRAGPNNSAGHWCSADDTSLRDTNRFAIDNCVSGLLIVTDPASASSATPATGSERLRDIAVLHMDKAFRA